MTKRKKKIGKPQEPSTPTPSNDIKLPEWTKILPQFYDAFAIVFLKKSYIELSKEKHNMRVFFFGLLGITSILVAVHLAIFKAPGSNPIDFYINDIKPFMFPELNLKMAAIFLFSVLTATCLSFWVATHIAKNLAGDDPQKLPSVQYLVLQIVNAGSTTYLAILVLILGTTFLMSWRVVWTAVDDYLLYCFTVLPISMALYFFRVFKILKFTINKNTALRAFLIAAYITMPTAIAAFFIFHNLNETIRENKLEKIAKIAAARKTPIPADVSTCEFNKEKVSCIIILRPNEWQDFELVGNWDLAEEKSTKNSSQKNWVPQTNSNTHFQLVSIEANKSKSVELSILANQICINRHSVLNAEDVLFTATGRRTYIDEQFNEGFGIKIRNRFSSLKNVLDDVCNKIL